MLGVLRYTRSQAAQAPLTPEGVGQVVAEARRAVLGQALVAVLISAGLLLISRLTGGPLSVLFAGVGLLSLWGVLATVLAAWDHARVSKLLRKKARAEIFRERDPKKFWWAHRGLFPCVGS